MCYQFDACINVECAHLPLSLATFNHAMIINSVFFYCFSLRKIVFAKQLLVSSVFLAGKFRYIVNTKLSHFENVIQHFQWIDIKIDTERNIPLPL